MGVIPPLAAAVVPKLEASVAITSFVSPRSHQVNNEIYFFLKKKQIISSFLFQKIFNTFCPSSLGSKVVVIGPLSIVIIFCFP